LIQQHDIPFVQDRPEKGVIEQVKRFGLDEGVARPAGQHEERRLGVGRPRSHPQEAKLDLRPVRPVGILGHNHIAALMPQRWCVLGVLEEAMI
jgi:hypothetical protein